MPEFAFPSQYAFDFDVVSTMHDWLDATLRALVASGVHICGAKKVRLSPTTAQQLYASHQGKFFYDRLVRHVTSGDVVALKVLGEVRACIGGSKTWPRDYSQLSVRQRFALSDVRNVVHASDADAAPRELVLFEPFPSVDATTINKIFINT